MIFYVGIAIVSISTILLIVYMVVSRIKLIKLNNRLDEEYGKIKSKE